MPPITDVRTPIWEWIGPVAPMPPHFCATASDLVSDVTGSISNSFYGEPIAEAGCIDLADDKPGFGLTLKTPDENFKLTR